jgi:hypothetical protein
MLVSQNVSNLLGGISQLPPVSRLDSEGTAQVNEFDNPSRGKMKRPPVELIGKMSVLSSSQYDNAFIEVVNINGSRYVIVIPDDSSTGNIQVFNTTTGAELTGTFPNGKGYVATAPAFDSADQFRILPVGSVVFVANRLKVVGKTVNTVATRAPEALAFVRQADFSTTYKLTVDATTLTYTTVDGANAAARGSITTDNIAEQLRLLFVASALNATHTCTRTGSTLYIKRINNADFTITSTDGLGDAGLLAIKGKIQRFDDLPLRAVNGVIVEVQGDPGSLYDNYYVVYDDTGSAGGAGVWRETVKPAELYQLDPATMPYVLTITSPVAFTFAQATWRNREVGSLVTNPFPSFVGNLIKDVFFTQGRLGVTSGENVILSGIDDLFNFFRKSAKALYDNDPIDINSDTAKVNYWHSVVEWNQNVLLWSDRAQAVLTGGSDGTLTPKNVGIKVLTTYENNFKVRPEVVGDKVYFIQLINGKPRISQYRDRNQSDSQLPEAEDITSSIAAYVQGNPVALAGMDQPGFLAVTSKGAVNSLYIYVNTEVQGVVVPVGHREHLEDHRPGYVPGRPLARREARRRSVSGEDRRRQSQPHQVSRGHNPVLLDHATSAVGGAGGTSYLLPNSMAVATNGSEGEVVVVRTDTMVEVVSTRPDTTHVQVATNLTGIPITYGIRYTGSYTLSPIAVVKQLPKGQVKETVGRLIVGHVFLRLADTQYVKVTVTSPEGTVYTYVYSQATPFTSDTLVFPVQADATLGSIVLSSDSAMQHTITGYDWEGHQVVRSTRR